MVGLAGHTASTQMLSYSRGQNVSPAFEGWEKNDDGSFNMMFGYMNRNWEEEPDVPIGPAVGLGALILLAGLFFAFTPGKTERATLEDERARLSR